MASAGLGTGLSRYIHTHTHTQDLLKSELLHGIGRLVGALVCPVFFFVSQRGGPARFVVSSACNLEVDISKACQQLVKHISS